MEYFYCQAKYLSSTLKSSTFGYRPQNVIWNNNNKKKWFGSSISHFNFHVIKMLGKKFTSAVVSSVDSKLLEELSVLLLKQRRKRVLKEKILYCLAYFLYMTYLIPIIKLSHTEIPFIFQICWSKRTRSLKQKLKFLSSNIRKCKQILT